VQLWQLATSPVNLPLTVLMGLVILYWIASMLSGLDLDSDVDLDLDAEVGDVAGIGSAIGVLSFFNIGLVPLSILMSVFVFTAWLTSLLVTGFLPERVAGLGYLLYLPNLVWAALATKTITSPIARGMRRMIREERTKRSVVAKIGHMLSDNDGVRLSQCEIPTDGAPYRVNVKARAGCFIPKGTRVLVIERSEDGNFYYVENTDELEI